MLVRELIQILEKMPQDLPVKFYDHPKDQRLPVDFAWEDGEAAWLYEAPHMGLPERVEIS